jgi:predicted MFS family arabinose efflux permease
MKKESALLFILAALQFTNIVDFMIMMPLGDVLMKLFKIGPQQFSVIVSAYTISAGISGFLGAFLIDRFDRKVALKYIYLGFTIGTFACGLAPNYEMLVLARIFTGMFGGIIGALVISIVSDIIPVERRSTAMGVVTAAFSVASVLGVPGSLYIANLYSWHIPFFVLGGISSILLIASLYIIPSIKAHLDLPRKSPKQLLTILRDSPNQQKALLFMFLLVMGQFSVIPFITPYMIRNVGLTQGTIPFIYLVGGGLTIFSSPLIGKLADKYGRQRIFVFGAAFSIIPLLIITNLVPIPIYFVLTITGIFFISITGRMIPAMSLMTSIVKPENRGSFMSMSSSVQQLSAGAAAFISGNIVIQGTSGLQNYNYVGYLAVAATLVAIFMSYKLKTLEGR